MRLGPFEVKRAREKLDIKIFPENYVGWREIVVFKPNNEQNLEFFSVAARWSHHHIKANLSRGWIFSSSQNELCSIISQL